MAKSSGGTRSNMPNRNPQFSGVSNKGRQMSHQSKISDFDSVIDYLTSTTGENDRKVLEEWANIVYDYTGGSLYDLKRIQSGMTEQEWLQSENGKSYQKAKERVELTKKLYEEAPDEMMVVGFNRMKNRREAQKQIYDDAKREFESSNNYSDLKRKTKLIEELIDKSPKWYGGTTYRGVKIPAAQIAKFKVGDEIGQGGLSSWSTSYGFSRNWEKGTKNACMFICEKPQNGTSFKFNCRFDGDEVVVSQKARWKITRIEKKDNGYTHIYVEPTYNKNGASY